MAQKLAITLKKSPIGSSESKRVTLRTLGLNTREQTVYHQDNAAIRGMIKKVSHLVEIQEVEE